MKAMAIYLAGPMLDFTGDFKHEEAQGWREELAQIAPTGVLFFSPAHAFFGASQATAHRLDQMERAMIAASDGLLANLATGHPAFGTIRDIEFARSGGMPVAVCGDVSSLMAHDLFVKPTLEEAFDALLEAIRTAADRPTGYMLRLPLPPMLQEFDPDADPED